MFRYSFERAVKLLDYRDAKEDLIEINCPEPCIIVIEEGEEIPDVLGLKFNFPKQGSFTYECNIMKYYEKDIETLREKNMYLLLPLSIVKLRNKLKRVGTHKEINEQDSRRIIFELKEISEKTLKTLDILYNKSKITLEDYDEIVTIMENIGTYLESNYGNIIGIEEKINTMVKSFYDPKVEEEGIEKGKESERKELLLKQFKKGLTIEFIANINDLDIEYVKKVVGGDASN